MTNPRTGATATSKDGLDLCRLMVEVTLVKNQSNWSSGVQIPRYIFTRFGCYLYSADWS